MFQSFDVTARPEQGPPRLAALRAEMAQDRLDGFLVPRADAHQGEYVAPCDERLAWLTGFTGSAGFCAVLSDVAGVFVDGRYRTQVKHQVAPDFSPVDWPEVQLSQWLQDNLPNGGVVGFDPWLHTCEQIEKLKAALHGSGVSLFPGENLVDRIWKDRPDPPTAPAKVHPVEFAGESHGEKRQRLSHELAKAGHEACLITLPDSLCWLLNLRGADIPRNPIAQGFCLLSKDASVRLYMPPEKLRGLEDHLGPDISVHEPKAMIPDLEAFSGPVRIDKTSAPIRLAQALGENAVFGDDPCALPKARKNAAEIAGSAAAHLRDGAAVTRALAWLDAQPPGTVTEIDVVQHLEALRREDNALAGHQF